MKNKYDIVIVGMGPSSIFCAYELIKLNSNKKILLIEKGRKIEDRICPISKTGKCLNENSPYFISIFEFLANYRKGTELFTAEHLKHS